MPKLSRTPGGVRWAGPWQLGQRTTDEVYGELLGLDADELAELAEAGVI